MQLFIAFTIAMIIGAACMFVLIMHPKMDPMNRRTNKGIALAIIANLMPLGFMGILVIFVLKHILGVLS